MGDCFECGAKRPIWHGGKHECLKLHGTYQLGHERRVIDERELEFLRVDYAGLR